MKLERTHARLGYLPALDGLRGVAILLVVGQHYFNFPGGGGQGVDLFFVLSGFLITTLLLEDQAAKGRADLRAFYARRARRLLPALVVLLSAFALLGGGFLAIEYLGLYTGNVAVEAHPWLAHSPLVPLWSLAEEEQFYLVWPLLLLVFGRSRRILEVLVGLFAALVAYRISLVLGGASLNRVYYGPDVHSDGLVAGCALAIFRFRRPSFSAPEWVGKAGGALLVPGVLLRLTVPQWQAYALPVVELACVGLVAAAVSQTELAQGLAARPIVWVGKISYSLYLWNLVIAWRVHERFLGLVAAFAVAWVSYTFVEQPFRRRRRRRRPAGGSPAQAPSAEPAASPIN